MVFSALALNASAAAPKVRQTSKSARRPSSSVSAKPAFAARPRADVGVARMSGSRRVASRMVIAAAGGEGDELADDENNNRANAAEAEVVEDDDDEEDEDEVAEEAPPTRVSEILAQLQAAVEEGNGGDVLAEVLPELATEVAGIESAFKDIQAANVGLEDQAGAVKDQFLRLTADFDNFKKRTIKEKAQLGETAKGKVFEAMLPALDNFDLAKANLKGENEGEEKIIKQYQGLVDGLMGVLTAQGLTPVEGVGTAFDPNFHEAIMREESGEPEDVIIEEFRKGYKMGEDTLIRASMVKVSAGPAGE